MKKEIENREDVVFLVDRFYEQVLTDEVIGFIFTDVAKISVEKHMPIMYKFWESILLGESSYRGNPMLKHIDLNTKVRLESKHFERWKALFSETLDKYFEGEKAEMAKQRAENIGRLMEHKIRQSENWS